MINEQSFVQLANDCSHLCCVLKTGVQGRDIESLNTTVRQGIDDLEK